MLRIALQSSLKPHTLKLSPLLYKFGTNPFNNPYGDKAKKSSNTNDPFGTKEPKKNFNPLESSGAPKFAENAHS